METLQFSHQPWVTAARHWAIDEPLIKRIIAVPVSSSDTAADRTQPGAETPVRTVITPENDPFRSAFSPFLDNRGRWFRALETIIPGLVAMVEAGTEGALDTEDSSLRDPFVVWPPAREAALT